jgi:hypothetical protein
LDKKQGFPSTLTNLQQKFRLKEVEIKSSRSVQADSRKHNKNSFQKNKNTIDHQFHQEIQSLQKKNKPVDPQFRMEDFLIYRRKAKKNDKMKI